MASARESDEFKYDAFISYSHRNHEWVHTWLLPKLETAGLKVCIDNRDFEIGAPALVNMERAVEQSRKTILVLTPDWIESEWTEFESLLAQTNDPAARRQRMLPLMLKECDLPGRLAMLTYADFRDETGRDFQLARVVRPFGIVAADASQDGAVSIMQPDLVHPYVLHANFTGRVKERKALTAWYVEQKQPVYALIAIGGMGKSAVSWVWMLQDLLGKQSITEQVCKIDETRRPGGVLWWSFCDTTARFASFLDHALTYASAGTIDPHEVPSEHDKVDKLPYALDRRRDRIHAMIEMVMKWTFQ